MGAREGECWGVGPCTHCAQWEGLVIPWVHVRESAGVWVPAHTVPSGRVIPWVHVRECAGVWFPAHTVPSGRGYTMGAREGEYWGVGPCTHCVQWEGLYHGCT